MPPHAKTGFIVIAPDRGALGNQDIWAVFNEFKAAYAPASLVFVRRAYKGSAAELLRLLTPGSAQPSPAGLLTW